jgi:hypothetical protein
MSSQGTERQQTVRTPKHLTVADDGIRFTDPDAAALQPSVWIDAFRVAIAHGRGVSLEARACIQENLLHCAPEDVLSEEADRQALLDLLSRGRAPRLDCWRWRNAG